MNNNAKARPRPPLRLASLVVCLLTALASCTQLAEPQKQDSLPATSTASADSPDDSDTVILSFESWVKGQRCGADLMTLLDQLRHEYSRRSYSPDEIGQLLTSLRRVVSSEQSIQVGWVAECAPSLRYPYILILDPTCGRCAQVAKLAIGNEYVRSSLDVILIGKTAPAKRAVQCLAAIESERPDRFTEAIVDFAQVLSRRPELLSTIARDYLTDGTLCFDQEEAVSTGTVADCLEERRVSAPTLVFRGRLIRRDASHAVPFDPFRDKLHFSVVAALLECEERSGGDHASG